MPKRAKNDDLLILQGSALDRLRKLPDNYARCCVTSPPYWGLRDYGTAKWKGGDPNCDHVGRSQTSASSTLAKWKKGGGKRYKESAGGMPNRHECAKCGAKRVDNQIGLESTPDEYVAALVEIFREVRRVLTDDGTLWLNLGDSYCGDSPARKLDESQIKPKDLIGIPWRVAFALQADGWWVRSDIIWAKPNPMPESVTDRPTKSHEYVFLLSKSASYFYDYRAILEPAEYDGRNADGFSPRPGGGKNTIEIVGHERWPNKISFSRPEGVNEVHRSDGQRERGFDQMHATDDGVPARNKRTVWNVATRNFDGAHFATYPPDLIKPCILAGTEFGDVVLDPFAGSGTTGMVAIELGRKATLIELNPEYIDLIEQRCDTTPALPLDFNAESSVRREPVAEPEQHEMQLQ